MGQLALKKLLWFSFLKATKTLQNATQTTPTFSFPFSHSQFVKLINIEELLRKIIEDIG